jgi:hypothetical protein
MKLEQQLRVWCLPSVLVMGVSAAALAQQGPVEKPTCSTEEKLVGGQCVPWRSTIVDQTVVEDPRPTAPKSPVPSIPRCHRHELVKDGKCVADPSWDQPQY